MTDEQVPVQRVLQEIVAGRCDDRLNDISSAIMARVKESMSTYAWRFTLDGVDVGELDVTLDEWSQIQKRAGVNFSALTPEIDVNHGLAIGTVLLHTRGGLSLDDAAAKVGALTARDVPEVFRREFVSAPFDTADPTST